MSKADDYAWGVLQYSIENRDFDISKCLMNRTCAELIYSIIHDLKANLTIEFEGTQDFVRLIGGPIILSIGTFGNILSLISLWKLLLRKTFYIYLFALTISDISVLYFGLFDRWPTEASGFTLRQTPIGCKVLTYCCYVFSFMSVWLVVAANIDRFVAVYLEFKSIFEIQLKRTLIVITVICTLSVTIPLHLLWTIDVEDHVSPSCQDSSKSSPILWKIWPWVDLFLYFLIPLVLITTMNGLILWKIQHRNISERSIHSSTRRQSYSCCLKLTRQRRSTILLIAISVTFLITTSPYTLAVVFLEIWPHYEENRNTTAATITSNNNSTDEQQIIYSFFELLMYLNHSVNFFLYCLCGKQFRQRLLASFSSRSGPNQHVMETTL